MAKTKVLFICMGNICRSPTAEGVFVELLKRRGMEEDIHVESAGTHAYHVGKAPDPRAREAAMKRGIDLGGQTARRVDVADFELFDYLLAMDRDNLVMLHEICPPDQRHKLGLFLEYAPHLGETEVPDPYYGGASGFERVLDMIEAASEGLLESILQKRGK